MFETIQKFIENLTSSFPKLQPLLASHRADNMGDLLPHVFLGEVVLWLVGLYASQPSNRETMLLVEEAFVRGDESTQELIAVSFVENLPSTGEPGASIRQFLGPVLEEQFQRLNWLTGLGSNAAAGSAVRRYLACVAK